MSDSTVNQKIKHLFHQFLETPGNPLPTELVPLLISSGVTKFSPTTIRDKLTNVFIKKSKTTDFNINKEFNDFLIDIKSINKEKYQLLDVARILITDYKHSLKIIDIELVLVKDLKPEIRKFVTSYLKVSGENTVILRTEIMAIDSEDALNQFLTNILEVYGLLGLFWPSHSAILSSHFNRSYSPILMINQKKVWHIPNSPSTSRLTHGLLLDVNQECRNQLEKYTWLSHSEIDDESGFLKYNANKVRTALYWYGNAVTNQGALSFLSLITTLEVIIQNNGKSKGKVIAKRVAVSLSDDDDRITKAYIDIKNIYQKRNDTTHRGITNKEDYDLLHKTRDYVQHFLIYALNALSNSSFETFEQNIIKKVSLYKELFAKADL